jgi:hypothetical protein
MLEILKKPNALTNLQEMLLEQRQLLVQQPS